MHTADTDYLYDCGSFKSRYYPDNYPINYVHTWYLDTRKCNEVDLHYAVYQCSDTCYLSPLYSFIKLPF